MATSKKVKLGLTRLSYVPDLFKPRAQEEGKAEKYGCTLLISKTDSDSIAKLEEIVVEACVSQGWGDDAKVKKMIVDGLIKMPVLNGDGPQGMNKTTGERHPGYEGHFFVRTSSGAAYKPVVVDEQVQPIATYDPSRLKSGDYGYPVVSAYAWDHPKTGKGASINIDTLQKIKSGDSLGGGGGAADPSQFFKAEKVAAENAPAETQGGAGAGGLFG